VIQSIFNNYKDPHTNKIEINGLQKFFDDIGVDPVDPLALLISKYMNAETMGMYSFEEFEAGFKNIGVGSIDEFKKKVPSLR
jgi:DCN1-like protein 1/2